MKKSVALGILVVLLAFAGMAAPAVADSPSPTTFEFPGGSLTTANWNMWGGVSGATYPVAFNVDAAGVGNPGLQLDIYGLDMSQIIYGGSWGWPPTPDDLGGLVMAGITGSSLVAFDRPNAAWFQLHSALGMERTWEQAAGPLVDQTNYRKYLLQAWHRGLTGAKVSPDGPNNHQYNVERYMGPAGRTESGCAGYTPDPEYDTFDLRIDFTPLGSGQYKMEGWIRLHKASSWDEMICKPHPFKWQWNAAMNNDGQPKLAWIKIGGHMPPAQQYRVISNVDFSAVFPFIQIANWGTTQTTDHVASWGRVEVTGVPNPEASMELCKKDGWMLFTDPSFKNQGQCVSYFAKMK